MKEKIKVAILLTAEFLAIAIILLLIFFAGKKSYTVTFDLNGGTLIAGDVEQRVTQGHSANPPQVVKDGHYFLRWSGSYSEVTHDTTVVAIWEYETTAGIEYSDAENTNYCEIISGYKGLSGDVYVGAYHDGKKVLGIKEGAFKNCVDIENLYLLDGILRIDREAFSGCINMKTIELPSTTVAIEEYAFIDCVSLTDLELPKDLQRIGAYAFESCESLERIVIPEGVTSIGDGAFKNCTALTEIVLPSTLETIGDGAFENCENLKIVVIDEGTTTVGENAFAGCTALTKVVLPSTIEEIGENAFDATVEKIYICTDEKEFSLDLDAGWCAPETELVFGNEALTFKESLKEQEPATEE